MEKRTKLIIPRDVIQDIHDGLEAMANEKPETSSGPLSEFAKKILVLLDLGWSDASIATRITEIIQKAGFEDLVVEKHHIARLRKKISTKIETKAVTKNRPTKRPEEAKPQAPGQEAPTPAPPPATNHAPTLQRPASRFAPSSGRALG